MTAVVTTPASNPTTVITDGIQQVHVAASTPSATIVTVQEHGGVTLHTDAPSPTTITTTPTVVDITVDVAAETVVIGTAAEQGPRGPAGGSTSYPAGSLTPLSGHKVVKLTADGTLVYADCRSAFDALTMIGVITNAVNPGDTVIPVSEGIVTHLGWAWTPNQPIFLGIDGDLTQVLPGTAVFVKRLGLALSSTSIALNFTSPAINI